MGGIVDNLINALTTWNEKLNELWAILTQSPTQFKGGAIWSVIVNIHSTLQGIGLALVVLFFVIGICKSFTNWQEIKRPEQALKLFIRFVFARGLVVYGMDIMTSCFDIVQGIILKITSLAGISGGTATLPQEIINATNELGFLDSIPIWALSLIGGLFITILSFVMILTVYGRFFKIYMYTAISPIPLAAYAGEGTQHTATTFIKSYIGVCLEGAIIVLACVIFTAFASSQPAIDPNASASTMIWSYVGEIIFNMLVLVGTVKMSDRIVKEMMGL